MIDLAKYAVPFVGTVLSIVPVVAGRRGWQGRQPGERLIWRWLAFGALLAIGMAILGLAGVRNAMLAQFTFPIFVWLGLDAIGALAGISKVRTLMRAIAIAYVGWWGWWLLDANWLRTGFAVHSGTMLSVVMSLGGLILMSLRLADAGRQPWRDPALIASMAILLSYLPGLPIEPVWAELFGTDPEASRRIADIHGISVSLGYLVFTAAFLVGRGVEQACPQE